MGGEAWQQAERKHIAVFSAMSGHIARQTQQGAGTAPRQPAAAAARSSSSSPWSAEQLCHPALSSKLGCGGPARADDTCAYRSWSLVPSRVVLPPPCLAWPGFLAAGQNVRKLIKDGFIIRKPQKIHSRARARAAAEAKAKGRHTGYGGCCGGAVGPAGWSGLVVGLGLSG